MNKSNRIAAQTRQNWLIDVAVFLGALSATITGIYFLILPLGGYQGGRNPTYGLTFLFGRATWDDLHTWGGLLMIIAVVVHLAWHWSWVKMMGRRLIKTSLGTGSKFSRGAKINVIVDLMVALGFLATAVSGIYFLTLPSGYQGGRAPGWDPGFLFSRTTWDMLHTWGAIVMILAAVLHLIIHWRWIVNVTRRFWLSLWSGGGQENQLLNFKRKNNMIKKILLGSIFILFAGALIAGGIYRTTAKSANETREENQITAVGGQGQGNGRSAGGQLAGQGQGQDYRANGQGRNQNRNPSGEVYLEHESVVIEGSIVQAPAAGVDMIVRMADGQEILIGTGPGYLQEMGYELLAGDTVQVVGFWEDGEFKAETITRDGEMIALRDEFGRPMWSGAARNARGGDGQGNRG